MPRRIAHLPVPSWPGEVSGAAHLLPVSPSGESLDGLDTGVLDLTFDDDSFVSALSCLPHPGHDDGAVPPSCAGAR